MRIFFLQRGRFYANELVSHKLAENWPKSAVFMLIIQQNEIDDMPVKPIECRDYAQSTPTASHRETCRKWG